MSRFFFGEPTIQTLIPQKDRLLKMSLKFAHIGVLLVYALLLARDILQSIDKLIINIII